MQCAMSEAAGPQRMCVSRPHASTAGVWGPEAQAQQPEQTDLPRGCGYGLCRIPQDMAQVLTWQRTFPP